MIKIKDLAEELKMSVVGVRYRADKLGADTYKNSVSEIDAQRIRNFWRVRKVEHYPFIKDFLKEVEEELLNSGMTKKELAKRSEIGIEMLRNIFKGERGFSFDFAHRIAEALDMNLVLCLADKE
jgi:ribosome-binding protein aMBF1 (putative translation factor)